MNYKTIAGWGLLGTAALWAFLAFRPKPPPDEELAAVRIDEYILHDPSEQRIIAPGGEIRITVAWTNVGEIQAAPRFRVTIWNGSSPIEGEWMRSGPLDPGQSDEIEVFRDVPRNWAPGWAVSVRLDRDGAPTIDTWESYFDIVVAPGIGEFEIGEIVYTVPS